MKIIIHSLDELLELTALIRGGSSTTKVGEIEHTIKVDTSDFDPAKLALEINDHCATLQGQYEFEAASNRGQNELPHAPNVETLGEDAGTLHLDGSVTVDYEEGELDIDGLPWDARINSGAKTQTGKGVWKRLRGVTDEVYETVRAELISARRAHELSDAPDDAEPVATETHALPQDESELREADMTTQSEVEVAPTVDHAALIEASQEAAKDAPDGTIDLLNAGKVFISEYGTAKFEALKAAVSPLEDGKGKPIPSLTPGERRLLRACMDNYALYL